MESNFLHFSLTLPPWPRQRCHSLVTHPSFQYQLHFHTTTPSNIKNHRQADLHKKQKDQWFKTSANCKSYAFILFSRSSAVTNSNSIERLNLFNIRTLEVAMFVWRHKLRSVSHSHHRVQSDLIWFKNANPAPLNSPFLCTLCALMGLCTEELSTF